MKRGEWKTGRIVAVYPGSDGLVRVVDLQTESGIYRRGIVGIALLEPAPGSAGSSKKKIPSSGEDGSSASAISAISANSTTP